MSLLYTKLLLKLHINRKSRDIKTMILYTRREPLMKNNSAEKKSCYFILVVSFLNILFMSKYYLFVHVQFSQLKA